MAPFHRPIQFRLFHHIVVVIVAVLFGLGGQAMPMRSAAASGLLRSAARKSLHLFLLLAASIGGNAAPALLAKTTQTQLGRAQRRSVAGWIIAVKGHGCGASRKEVSGRRGSVGHSKHTLTLLMQHFQILSLTFRRLHVEKCCGDQWAFGGGSGAKVLAGVLLVDLRENKPVAGHLNTEPFI